MAARQFFTPIDMTKLEIRNLILHLLSAEPGSPVEGQLFYNTTNHNVEFRRAADWVVLGSLDQITKAAADVDINTHKLINVTDPSSAQHAATKNYVDTRTINDLTAPAADFSMNSHKITSLSTPTASGDAATKGYVDGLISGVSSWKTAVRAASTANGTLATAFENGDTMDGITLATGNRILLKNQTAPEENGIYVVAASGAPARATDADAGSELLGAAVWVEEGSTLADTGWVQTVDGTITVNTTGLTFVQFSGAGQITAGTGMSKSGNTLNVGAGSTPGTGGPGGGLVANADDMVIDKDIVVRKFAVDVGDGASTSIVITHNLGTLDCMCQVYVKGTGGSLVECDIQHTTTNTITLVFAVAPTSAQFRAIVQA